jgi:hypothetical protein
MKFEMNPGWQKAVEDEAVASMSARYDAILDEVFRQCSGSLSGKSSLCLLSVGPRVIPVPASPNQT